MPDFFISRAGADSERAKWIASVLREAGYDPLFQDDHSEPGRSFYEFMEAGAEFRTIAICSDAYFKSDACRDEWRAAYNHRRLIPVRFEEFQSPALWSTVVYVDLMGKSETVRRVELLARASRGKTDRPPLVSIAKLPAVNPTLIGRDRELDLLDDAWTNPRIRLVSFAAFGGVGKTALAINWWQRNGAAGARRILGWSFYSQGAGEDRQASADSFLDHALREWFGVADPPKDSWARGERLAQLIRREPALLILDGLEPIQHLSGQLKDMGMAALLRELTVQNPGLCICTSRISLTDLEGYGAVEVVLENLSSEAGAELLKTLGAEGSDDELQGASKEFGNHALALTLLGTLIKKRKGGDIRKRDTIPSILIEPKRGGHARRLLRQYESLFKGKPELTVLRMLGLFDRPADPGALRVLRTMSDDDWAIALDNLADARLIEFSDPDGFIDCHPLVREHFAEEYCVADPGAFRAAHSLLCEYYSKQAPYQPDTLDAMQPLLHAVIHGCRAGEHLRMLDVYQARIQRYGAFLRRMHGATGTDLSLLGNFFESPWKKPISELSAAKWSYVATNASYALRALGRLAEAVETLEACTTNSPIRAGSLSEVHLTLGNVTEAVAAARSSVDLADFVKDAYLMMASRTTLAHALHQSGDLTEAPNLFAEAENIQAIRQSEFPLLSSVFGYRYCEFLRTQGRVGNAIGHASQTVRWVQEGPLLDLALDHLTLGHLDEAVNCLRRAGTLDHLPRGLLARAAHYREIQDWEKAQHDLEEVRILATRCGMRLFLTDYHLEQARLILAQDPSNKAGARLHFEKAKQLIEDTGYHRRDKERDELAAALTS